MSNIFKVWGQRRRVLLTDKTEIDLLYVTKDCFCSTHKHKEKINKFVVVSGKVKVQTPYGTKILGPNEDFTVEPPLVHRFYALEDSIMIELAYVKDGFINPHDIDRISQGGRVIEGEEITLEEIQKRGLDDA